MKTFNKLFILWAVSGTILAYLFPSLFIWFQPYIVHGLSLIMFGMGITLSWHNFTEIFKRPKIIGLGVILQFSVMPLSAFLLSRIFGLSRAQTLGMVLVGSCPGGTASNVICYLAGANVALSITMTAASTILAVAATPLMIYLYIHQTIDVPVISLFKSVLKIVILPVCAGTLLNTFFHDRIKPLRKVFPSISVVIIAFVIAAIVGLNKKNIGNLSIVLMAAIILHNGSGLILGYWIPRLLGFDRNTCKTLSIEVGMQNSGLAVALGAKHFAAMTAATLPGAIFSIWHNITGSFLASLWNRKQS